MAQRKRKRRLVLLLATLVLFLLGFTYYQQATLAYNIVVEGEVIGQVKDSQLVEEALAGLIAAKEAEIGREVVEAQTVELEKTRLDQNLLVSDPARLIEDKIDLTTDGYTLVINGEPLFAVLNGEGLKGILEDYKKSFEAAIDEKALIESSDFEDEVEVVPGKVPLDSLVDLSEARQVIYSMKEEPLTVTVKKGDTFWLYSKNYRTTVDDLIALNPDLEPERIRPGDVVTIRPGTPFLDVLTTMKNTVIEEIPHETEYKKDSSMLSRDRVVLKKGANGEKRVEYLIVLKNGFQHSIEVLDEEVLKEPVTQVVKVGTKTTLARGVGGRNYGVVQARRISSGFGWRIHPISGKRIFHEGVDLAAPTGTPVYAFADGVVKLAGWSGGYGKAIYIDHGNGLQTRYGHLSSTSVRVGQKVKTGQKIGAVGNTGYSTGPHLHFEVRKNGAAQNPWNYL